MIIQYKHKYTRHAIVKMYLKNHQEDKECANDIQFPSVPWLQVHLLMRNGNNLYCLSQYSSMLTLIYEARHCENVFEKSSRRQGMCKSHKIHQMCHVCRYIS